MDFDPRKLPSPYYRVATRAIIFDDQKRMLVMENQEGEIELPGGGIEFGETHPDCLKREIREELGAELVGLGPFVCIYQGRGSRGIMYMRIAFRAELASHDFSLSEMKRAWFVSQPELLQLDLRPAGEEGLKQFAEQIWAQ